MRLNSNFQTIIEREVRNVSLFYVFRQLQTNVKVPCYIIILPISLSAMVCLMLELQVKDLEPVHLKKYQMEFKTKLAWYKYR